MEERCEELYQDFSGTYRCMRKKGHIRRHKTRTWNRTVRWRTFRP